MTIEPRIRYPRTSDDVNIAFWTVGEGRPIFVSSPLTFCHAGLEGRIPKVEALYRQLASEATVVRWDVRNYGMSQRGVERLGPEFWAADVLAVADELELDRFDFLGINFHPTVAALEPSRVRRMALVSPPPPRLSSLLDDPDQAAVRSLAATNWQVFTEAHGNFLQSWQPDPSIDYSRFIRESVNQGDYLRIMSAWREWDVTDQLPRIECPTLIVTRPDAPTYHRDGWLTYASTIPQATLLETELGWSAGRAVWAEVAAFLDGGAAGHPAERAEQEPKRSRDLARADGRLRTVLFTDIVDHTAMMNRLGDPRGRDVLREHERITRERLGLHGGDEIKTMGDGFFASFDSVTQAVQCAVELQRSFLPRSTGAESTPLEPIEIRIGINAGEPVEDEGDLFGATVILAARIAAAAGAGEILIPDAVRHLLAGKTFDFEDRGQGVLKGFDDPIRLFEVKWRG